jgi:hypothetical protein
MTDTTLPNKQLTEPQVGGDLNNWGDILNTNIAHTDAAFGGTTVFIDTSGNIVLSPAQYIPPNWAITGTLTGNVKYILPAGVGGIWTVYNAIPNPASNYTVTISSAGSPGSQSVVLPPGFRSLIVSDGAGNVQFASNGPQAQGFVTVSCNVSGSGSVSSADCFWTVANGLVTLRIGNLYGAKTATDVIITGFPAEVQPFRNESCAVQIYEASAPAIGFFTMYNSPFQAVLTNAGGNPPNNNVGLFDGQTIIYPLDTNIFHP